MEVYIDGMLVKSLKVAEHINNLRESFDILRTYKMKLNPSKCAFGVFSEKFLGFMVSHHGIEANPTKIQSFLNMDSPKKIKYVQILTLRVVVLNHFISQATDQCQPFFQALLKEKDFAWSAKFEQLFHELKSHLGQPPLLSKPQVKESLILYWAVSKGVVSSAPVQEEEGVQCPIYYTNKSLVDMETRYLKIEKLVLTLMVVTRKLQPYCQAQAIIVPTKFPLKQVFHKLEASGCLAKWSI